MMDILFLLKSNEIKSVCEYKQNLAETPLSRQNKNCDSSDNLK